MQLKTVPMLLELLGSDLSLNSMFDFGWVFDIVVSFVTRLSLKVAPTEVCEISGLGA